MSSKRPESDRLGTAVVTYACPICGKEASSAVIMNKKLTYSSADKVKEMHNKCVGYADKACEECAKFKNDVVYIVGIDPSKSEDPKNPYRTGKIVGIKKDCGFVKNNDFEKFIITLKDVTRFMFMEHTTGVQIGLWDNN